VTDGQTDVGRVACSVLYILGYAVVTRVLLYNICNLQCIVLLSVRVRFRSTVLYVAIAIYLLAYT